jgi:SagB-type dehydrogenase family enzyme
MEKGRESEGGFQKELWVGPDFRKFVSNEERLFEIFHENTKLNPLNEAITGAKFAELYQDANLARTLANAYSLNRGLAQVALPPRSTIDAGFSTVALTRRSCRNFADVEMSLDQLSTVLQHTYGITGRTSVSGGIEQKLRAVPSGGALYPLELYCVASRVNGLRRDGIYHYAPELHILEDLERCVSSDTLVANLPGGSPEWVRTAAATFIITAVFVRACYKYGDRGYRIVLLEAGAAAEHLSLACHAIGLGSCQVSGFYDQAVNYWTGVDGCNEAALGLVVAGVPETSLEVGKDGEDERDTERIGSSSGSRRAPIS